MNNWAKGAFVAGVIIVCVVVLGIALKPGVVQLTQIPPVTDGEVEAAVTYNRGAQSHVPTVFGNTAVEVEFEDEAGNRYVYKTLDPLDQMKWQRAQVGTRATLQVRNEEVVYADNYGLDTFDMQVLRKLDQQFPRVANTEATATVMNIEVEKDVNGKDKSITATFSGPVCFRRIFDYSIARTNSDLPEPQICLNVENLPLSDASTSFAVYQYCNVAEVPAYFHWIDGDSVAVFEVRISIDTTDLDPQYFRMYDTCHAK